VDEEDHQTSSRSGSNGSCTGESAAPRPDESQGGAAVTYYGDAARVREGFAIALGLLGLSAGMVDSLTRNQPEEEGE
jgi:hypothetical protein